MRLGENYLKYNLLEGEKGAPRVGQIERAWRKVLSVVQTFTPGDDLSHWNTINNWFLKQVEMKFSVLKLGEGNQTVADEKLWEFLAAAKASGTQVMLYWFFRSNITGELQLANCLALLAPVVDFLGYKPVMWVDVETSDGIGNATRVARLKVLVDGLLVWNPGKVGIYSSPGFANLHLTPVPAWINTIWQWIAHWTSAALPTQPNGWSGSMRKLWQIGVWNNYAWVPPVPGAEPDVDYNKFFGTEAELTAFTGASPALTLEEKVNILWEMKHTHL